MNISAEQYATLVEKWLDCLDTADSHYEENLISEFLDDLRELSHG